jgi:hypothetical protein
MDHFINDGRPASSQYLYFTKQESGLWVPDGNADLSYAWDKGKITGITLEGVTVEDLWNGSRLKEIPVDYAFDSSDEKVAYS